MKRMIRDEPKVSSWMELAYTKENEGSMETFLHSSFAGIEIRGRTSAAYEKKSCGLELWQNKYGDEIFTERIDTLLDLSAALEYYLFINLILAHDNIIKNYFLARYPGTSRFLFTPWDLEGSSGIMWHGGESSTNGILNNHLCSRILDLEVNEFNDLLESRWEDYRESIFQEESLLAPARGYVDLLKRSGAIERENERWESVDIDIDQALLYFSQWTAQRLDYLDLVFD